MSATMIDRRRKFEVPDGLKRPNNFGKFGAANSQEWKIVNIYFKNNFNSLVMNIIQIDFLYWQSVNIYDA